MKRVSIGLVLVLAMLVVGMVGCGEEAAQEPAQTSATSAAVSTTEGAVSTTAATQPSATSKSEAVAPIELKYASWSPSSSGMSQAEAAALKKIEELSGGRVRITTYFDASLLPYNEIYMGTAKGQADICKFVHSQNPGLNVLSEILDLPFMGLKGQDAARDVYEQLRAEFPEIDQEYEKSNMKLLDVYYMPGYHLHLAKDKEVRVPSDLKGMTIIGSNSWEPLMKAAGAALITPPAGEYYTSLERGLADGTMLHFAFLYAYKLYEVLNAHVLFGEGAMFQALGYAINLDVWNKLPADVQQLFMDNLKTYCAGAATQVDKPQIEKVTQICKDQGNTFVELSEQEIAKWAEAATPKIEAWVQSCVEKGYSEELARNLLARAKELAAATQ